MTEKDITKYSPEKRVASGIIRTFQLVRVFDNLSVYQNMGLPCYRKWERFCASLHMLFSNLNHPEIRRQTNENLEMFELDHLAEEMVGNLSLGSKRRLEIAMAFIANPSVLVLDEPFAGLGAWKLTR